MSMPITFSEHEFKDNVLSTLNAIPKGSLSTYGAIAKAAGYSGYARQVGYILKNLPEHSTIPWHRVINAQGRSSFSPGSERHAAQCARLISEGHPETLGKAHLTTVFWPIFL